jgi:regulator of protease activity HflC (stomatin/prohibitin superfamily)
MNPSFIGSVAASIFYLLGVLIGGLIGNIFSYPVTGFLCGLIISVGIYISIGITIVPEREARIIQRFGKHHRAIDKAGIYLLCFPGIIDHEFARFTINQDIVIELYKDGGEKSIVEFSDGQGKILAKTWIRIIDPQIYAYEISSPENYIEGLFDNYVRGRLAEISIDQALREKDLIAKDAKKVISKELRRTGVELVDLFIENIILLGEASRLREKRLRGKTTAEEVRQESEGWLLSIATIARGFIDHGVNEDKAIQDAIRIFYEQRGLDTIQKTQANVTFIADGVKGILGFFTNNKNK